MSDLKARMVAALRAPAEVDLGDERDAMRALRKAGFKDGEIITNIDDAIEDARRLGQNRTWS